jgi:hypothetical protein
MARLKRTQLSSAPLARAAWIAALVRLPLSDLALDEPALILLLAAHTVEGVGGIPRLALMELLAELGHRISAELGIHIELGGGCDRTILPHGQNCAAN